MPHHHHLIPSSPRPFIAPHYCNHRFIHIAHRRDPSIQPATRIRPLRARVRMSEPEPSSAPEPITHLARLSPQVSVTVTEIHTRRKAPAALPRAPAPHDRDPWDGSVPGAALLRASPRSFFFFLRPAGVRTYCPRLRLDRNRARARVLGYRPRLCLRLRL